MTLADFASTTSAELDVLWISPDANLWVAQGSGEFIGMVEFTEGHFVSTDRTGAVIDSFSDLPAARTAVVDYATMLASFAGRGRTPRPRPGARIAAQFSRRTP